MDVSLPEVLKRTLSELSRTQHALECLKSEHEALVGKFSKLRYTNIDTVWRFFPQYSNEFQYLPKVDLTLKESHRRVGGYSIGQVVGEGQFSTVYKCRKTSKGRTSNDEAVLAVKVLHKDRMLSIDNAIRTENEIKALQVLGPHPNVVEFMGCLHGRRGVYILTEEVPLDLVCILYCHDVLFCKCKRNTLCNHSLSS